MKPCKNRNCRDLLHILQGFFFCVTMNDKKKFIIKKKEKVRPVRSFM